MFVLRELMKIWIRARAIVILGIRLVASSLCLYVAHSFISHVIASLFITLVCFSNGWHKELSPTAFREWKGPRESVLASALSVLVLILYGSSRFWPRKQGESPLAHAHPPADPIQAADHPSSTFTQSLKPPVKAPLKFDFVPSRDSSASFGTSTTNGQSTPRQAGTTENKPRQKIFTAEWGPTLVHKQESSKDQAQGPSPDDVQLPGDSSTVQILPPGQATQERESAISSHFRPSQLSLSQRDATAGAQASPKTPSPPASPPAGGLVQSSQQDPPTEILDRPETQIPETTLDGEVAGSVEVKTDATSMVLKLESEFPNVRDYPMIELDNSKVEMDRRRDELENYCEGEHPVNEKTSNYPLFNSLEYYQLNRLTLWVAKNWHMRDSRRFPSDYPRQTNATEEDISQ